MNYRGSKTEVQLDPDPVVKYANRMALCVAACRGIDDAMLELLAQIDKDGSTNLQTILSKITWTGLPTQGTEIPTRGH